MLTPQQKKLIEAVLRTVCQQFHVTRAAIKGPSRVVSICLPRFITYKLLVQHGIAIAATARALNREYGAVKSGIASCDDEIATNPAYAAQCAAAVKAFRAGHNHALQEGGR